MSPLRSCATPIPLDQEPKVVKGLLEQRKGSQEFGSYEKMETKHSPRREGDESQDDCASLGARLSFPTSERKLRKLRFYYNGIMRQAGGTTQGFYPKLGWAAQWLSSCICVCAILSTALIQHEKTGFWTGGPEEPEANLLNKEEQAQKKKKKRGKKRCSPKMSLQCKITKHAVRLNIKEEIL